MKELTRFEMAAVKRVAANTKNLKTKVDKLNAKIAELVGMRDDYLKEISVWETPIIEKHGFPVDMILDGTYLITSNDVTPDFTLKDVAEIMEMHDADASEDMNVCGTI